MFYILIFLLLIGMGELYRRYALKKHILDIPGERSSHHVPIVRGGGILFFLGGLMAWLVTFYPREHLFFLMGFLLLSLIGWLDDRYRLSPAVRFPVQLIAVILILYDTGLFMSGFPLWVQILGVIVALGFINAFNFMDGINGITSIYSLVVLAGFVGLNSHVHLFNSSFIYMIIISVLAFSIFNFRKKALMFAGDIGTMSLGSILLWLTAKSMVELHSPVLILILVIYGVDSAMTIIRRLLKKENIFKPHRWHIYQHLVDRKNFSHLSVAILYATLQAFIIVILISLHWYQKSLQEQFFLLALILIIFVSIYLTLVKKV